MHTFSTQAYLDTLRELVEQGAEASVRISGGSMAPFLVHNRDYLYFKAPDTPLKPGDMVFYRRESGQYVMHRIWKIKKDGYYLVGDAQTAIEGPIARTQIFGRVTAVLRKGKRLEPGSFWWEFFAHVWRRAVPLRHCMLRAYGFLRKDTI